MVALDYDMKEFLRIVYNTKAFQRAAPTGNQFSRHKDESLPLEVKWVIAGPNPNSPRGVPHHTFTKVPFSKECPESNCGTPWSP